MAVTTDEVGVRDRNNMKKRATEIADGAVVSNCLFEARDVEVLEEGVAARAVVVPKVKVSKHGRLPSQAGLIRCQGSTR
jgi:hypothetical protein